MSALLVVITAYLLGSIPFGYLIVKATRGKDIRKSGSGGTGATNVSRSAGKFAGLITLALDALKGTGAILIAQLVLGDTPYAVWAIAASAIAVLLGHIFPVWLRFHGGKGVATGLGVFIILLPAEVGIAAVLFIAVVLSTRYVSLASLVGAAAIPLLGAIDHLLVRKRAGLEPIVAASVLASVLIFLAHRENVRRLINGTEAQFR